MSNPALEAVEVYKRFDEGGLEVEVLKGVSLAIAASETVAVLGASGSGKSTLLHLLGGLDSVTSGQIKISGQDLASLGARQIAELRNRKLGFVYQFHHLLAEFSALENVAMPLRIGGCERDLAYSRAESCLQLVGLAHRLGHRPGEMSGGERQRAAIARALVSDPGCVLADEPTGNLDSSNATAALEAMLALRNDVGAALVIVTHDVNIAKQLDRTIELADGRIV